MSLSFEHIFKKEPEARGEAPGRVNMLGEHTDYNDGFVLPTAIRQKTRVEIARSADCFCRLHSDRSTAVENATDVLSFRLEDPVPEGYASYVYGCIDVLRRQGFDVPPVVMAIRSNVPIGTGLSSSAALEVAVLRALRALLALPIGDVDLAKAAQQAEIHYAGVRCGIMDQMASSLADGEHMLFLDTRTLHTKLLPFPDASEIVVLDSGVPRELAASGYNERREECEAASRLLHAASLRDVADPDAAAALPAPLDRRARHVICENHRVLEAAAGVDAVRFGELMNASHASLRDDFEVSVPALDALVGALQSDSAVYGARLTGAGFGGACVALVENRAGPDVAERALAAYGGLGYTGRMLV